MALEIGYGQGLEEYLVHDRKSLDCLEVTIDRNIDDKGDSAKGADGIEEHVLRNWRKGDPCYKVAENA